VFGQHQKAHFCIILLCLHFNICNHKSSHNNKETLCTFDTFWRLRVALSWIWFEWCEFFEHTFPLTDGWPTNAIDVWWRFLGASPIPNGGLVFASMAFDGGWSVIGGLIFGGAAPQIRPWEFLVMWVRWYKLEFPVCCWFNYELTFPILLRYEAINNFVCIIDFLMIEDVIVW